MKAWSVHDGFPQQSSLLVFAETANRAKGLAMRAGLWEFDEYVAMRAKRSPQFDLYSQAERVIETNQDLPPGAPHFYNDSEYSEYA